MKTAYLIILIFINYQISYSQTPPPAGHQRGMYVDCVDALILEVVQNGNNASLSPLVIELITYAHDNFFTYIACFRLDHSSLTVSGFIVGDSLYDLAIQSFIKYAHAHSIQV